MYPFMCPLAGVRSPSSKNCATTAVRLVIKISLTNKPLLSSKLFRIKNWVDMMDTDNHQFLLLALKSINGIVPSLSKRAITTIPAQSLRSFNKSQLVNPKCNLTMYRHKTFWYTTPVLWNSLSDEIRNCRSLATFKCKLKAFLFKRVLGIPWLNDLIIYFLSF